MTILIKRQLAIALAMVCAAFGAQAVNYYWRTRVESGNWNDQDKWSPDGVPGIYDTASFTNPQDAPLTVSFTNDVVSKLALGGSTIAELVTVIFDLNGHTLTHTNEALHVQYGIDWSILNGTFWSHPTATALSIGYNQSAYVPKVTIGLGATYLHNGTTYVNVGSRSAGELVIQDGGRLITHSSSSNDGLRIGNGTGTGFTNYTARMTVTGPGSVWSNRVGDVVLANHKLATAELNITDNGAFVNEGKLLSVGNVSGANASLNIASGGVVDSRLALYTTYIGNYGTGTVTVTGSGSAFLAPTNYPFHLGNSDMSQGTLIIEKGGLFEKMAGNHNFHLGLGEKAGGRLIIQDGGVLHWAGGSGNFYVGSRGKSEGSVGEMTVTGPASRAILGEFIIGQNRGDALVTVADGGTVEAYRTMYVGRITTNLVSHNGSAKLVVTGTGSVLKKSALTTAELPNANIMVPISLGVGGCGFAGWDSSGLKYYGGYGPGGKGLAIIEDGGRVELDGTIGVYSNSTLRIDGGRTYSGNIGLETNAIFNVVLRSGDANGTALMTASGEVRIWGATLDLEKGADFVAMPGDVYTLITAGALHSTINRFTFDGAVVQDGDVINVDGTTFRVGYTASEVTLTVRNNGTMIFVR